MVPTVNRPGCALACAITSFTLCHGESRATNSARSKNPSVVTGAKSRCTSNGSLRKSPALTALALLSSSTVWPSGSACATAVAPTMAPALGRLSITIGCRSDTLISLATARAVRSAMPPGPNGTISVIGRLG